MQGFKLVLTSDALILIIGILGYWAIRTIEPGNIHAEREKTKTLESENEELQKEIEGLKKQLAQSEVPEPTPPPEEAPQNPAPTTSKYQSLINDLQKLADDKVYMKVGSRGTRVGTVQTFLNIYFKTNKKIDNDYGNSMKTDVANFQKAVGLSADGQAGPSTYLKMIDWLKKNS